MPRFLVVASASNPQLPETLDGAGAEIVSAYAPTVLVVDGDESAREAVFALDSVAAVSDLDGTIDASSLSMDDDTAAAVDAWNARFDPDLIAAKEQFDPGDAWNAPGGSLVDPDDGGEA